MGYKKGSHSPMIVAPDLWVCESCRPKFDPKGLLNDKVKEIVAKSKYAPPDVDSAEINWVDIPFGAHQ